MGRIALIDDSEDSLELFAVILKGHHEIVTFSRPQAFLDVLTTTYFDLVLLDIVMPGVDGFDVFRRIQEHNSQIPVVAVTAKAQPGEREKALRAGFCDYFVKPIIEIENFRNAVHSHVGRCANPPHEAA
jgi:CheY-like chemotaxis protein